MINDILHAGYNIFVYACAIMGGMAILGFIGAVCTGIAESK